MAASSSSSLIRKQSGYEVFLSFSGEDTRNSFISHLSASLDRHRFDTFRDDKRLKKGEDIASELLKAIEDSRIAIIVFSKNYAKSSWCLDELVKIMKCKKRFQQIVLPIFFDVYPSEVRKQEGSFTLKAKGSYEQVKEWRASLVDAANLSSWDLQNPANRDEAKVIEEIIQEVGRRLKVTHLIVVDHPVGLDRLVQKLETLLSMESNDVRIVAVWGSGGVGKTTIAKELYNRIHNKFEGSSFLANIRENSKQSNNVVNLQVQLLSDLVKNYTCLIRNTDEGINVLSRRAFYHLKVLLVLDDVDNDKQLKLLAINRSFFHPGSRIIITTRDKSSLDSLKVDELYEPMGLEDGESLELFNWHAFKEDGQKEDFEQLSRQVVCYAGGLPLALEVLGSFLSRKSKHEWESAIARLSKIPHRDIQGKLELSFDTLTLDEQQLFLDIACFFVGMDRDFTCKILEGYKMYPVIGVRVLANHCLIKYDCRKKFVLHDMIRDMGREIVRQESFREPGNRSRLWDHDDVVEVLKEGTGTEKVEGLFLNFSGSSFERFWDHEDAFEVIGKATKIEKVEGSNFFKPKYVQVSANAFQKMSRLRILHLDFVHLSVDYEHISRRLMWLSWKGFPLTCMPSNWSMENLVALNLSYSSLEQVWSGTKVLEKLKFLYLRHCHNLTTTPDFSGLRNLEELLLNDCIRLIEIHESISYLSKLFVLDVKNCEELKKLPSGIWMLKLECLDFSGCSKLEKLSLPSPTENVDSVQPSSWLKRLIMPSCSLSHLPQAIGNLVSLEELDIHGNNLHTLPASIGNLTHLKTLFMMDCKVSHLPVEIGGLISLEKLELGGNKQLSTLPESIGSLKSLKNLCADNCNLSHLPNEIGSLISLHFLKLDGNKLCALPDSFCNVPRLVYLDVGGNNLSHLPEGIGNLIELQYLDLTGNNLRILPDGFRNLAGLHHLIVDNCPRLESLSEISVYAGIVANNCPSLEDIPFESMCQCVPLLDFYGCQKLVENNFADNFKRRLLQHKGLSELKNCIDIILSVSAMDEWVLPNWLEYKNTTEEGLSLVVPPPHVSQKILGFVFCAVSTVAKFDPLSYEIHIHNKTKDCCEYFHRSTTVKTHDEDGVYLGYIPLCKFKHFESGDEILFHAKAYLQALFPPKAYLESTADDESIVDDRPLIRQFGLSIIYKEDETSIAETSDQSCRSKKRKNTIMPTIQKKKTKDQNTSVLSPSQDFLIFQQEEAGRRGSYFSELILKLKARWGEAKQLGLIWQNKWRWKKSLRRCFGQT